MIKAVIFDMYETLITLFDCPAYFGTQMAADAGIDEDRFYALWDPSEGDRTVGKRTLEDVLESVLRVNGRYSPALMELLAGKRTRSREEAFEHLNPQIIPMLTALRDKGLHVGLISNCFSEEAAVIKKSVLFPYFDAACLSFDEGVQKPDPEIFDRCAQRLGVRPQECLYVGDGGSRELEAARAFGMKPVQALWYLKDEPRQHSKRMPEFDGAQTPMELMNYL